MWSAWQHEDTDALDMTLANSLEKLGKHALNHSWYLFITSLYVSKDLPKAFCLPRTSKVIITVVPWEYFI